MKSCIILFVLVTLTTYCSGRTLFRMIELDESVDKTVAYRKCMRDCKNVCLSSHDCRSAYGDAETLCRDGADDDSLEWEGFVFNGRLLKACKTIISPPVNEPEPKHLFQPYELYRLFDTK
ncbi:hypothetical protein ACROYT_G017698 [Oculina patagonica]